MKYSYSVIYKKIEEEVIKLSSAIYFCDEQLMVYSVDIADLIMRCSVELEAIVKEIYYQETGVFNDKPREVLNWIEKNWKISKKKIRIEYPSFCFETVKEFCPFDYKPESPEDYYSSYNAIKHNRAQNIKKANINTLIRVLGALFVAETYYENKRICLSEDKYGKTINKMGLSNIFSLLVAPCSEEMILDSEKDIDPETCIYRIVRNEGEYAFRISCIEINGKENKLSLVSGKPKFQEYAKECVGKSVNIDTLVNILNDNVTLEGISSEEYLALSFKAVKILSIYAYKFPDRFYAELNKEG